MKYCLIDMSNILYRTFFANKNVDVETGTGLAVHTALLSMNKFYKQIKPNKIIAVFDRPSWRKTYTLSEQCVSKKQYKGNRRQNQTPGEQTKFKIFLEHIKELEEILRKHTSIVCLANEDLEADDLIAGFVEAYADDGNNIEDEIVILSRDRDLAQLLGKGDKIFSNVSQIDPTTGKEITVKTAIKDLFNEKEKSIVPEELYHNVDFFLFSKMVMGDSTDYIQSAKPGIRKVRIIKAYLDPYEQTNLLNETWTDINKNEFSVNDLYQENKKLINLKKQPKEIRVKIFKTIYEEMENPGKFSHFHFLRFLGKHDMKELSNNLEYLVPMLSS